MKSYLRLLAHIRPYAFTVLGAMGCMLLYSVLQGAAVFLVGPAVAFLFNPKFFDPATVKLGNFLVFEDLMTYFGDEFLILLITSIVVVFTVKGLADFGQAYLMGEKQ